MADEESYNDLVFKLGDVARERLAGRGTEPRAMERVLKAEDALLAKQEELKGIEAAMDEEEAAFSEFRQAVEDEKAQLADLVIEHKKAIALAEGKYKKAREKIASKEIDFRHAKESIVKGDANIAKLVSLGEKEKAAAATGMQKNLRMDVMKRTREIAEMEAEAAKIMERPGDDSEVAQAIRANHRASDLDKQMETREKEFNDALAQLDQQAAEKEQEIQGARDYYDQAIFLLGEEVYAERPNDPSLVPLFLRLDKAGQ